jgi:DNA transformation protein and related proteins
MKKILRSKTGHSGSILEMRNLGKASANLLAQIGIVDPANITELGALEVFWRVKTLGNNSVSLNLLWALEGAIADCHWTKIAQTRRSELLRALDARVDMLNKASRSK